MLALSIATLLGRRPPAEVSAEFSPSELFAASEVGVWYDPSDFSTLFENTDGTGAISTVEKPVGKMLDKSGNGFHATAANNGTARPVLRSRYNQLVYSEQFDNAAYGNFTSGTGITPTVTANQGTAPDGTVTADRIQFSLAGGTTTGDVTRRSQSYTTPATTHTFSVYLRSYDGTSTYNMHIVGPTTGATNIVVTGDWQRFVVSGVGTGTSVPYSIGLRGGQSPANSDTADVLAWGAQVVANSAFPANTYQRIAAATDYDTDATKFLPYLAFTTDDAMSTASIDFSATDEMSVFAGVTKNSDVGTAVISELSASSSSNSGSFAVFGSVAGGDKYRYRSGGSAYFDAVTASSVYSAPTTNVLTGLSDISLDSVVLRLDGSEIDANTGDQGSGNYVNYALYIGARNNSSLFFNGSLYSLIVRGKTSTAQEIDDTEAWVANKTGVTL